MFGNQHKMSRVRDSSPTATTHPVRRRWSPHRGGMLLAAAAGLMTTCFGWNEYCVRRARQHLERRDYEAAESALAGAVLLGRRGELSLLRAKLARKELVLREASRQVDLAAAHGVDDLRIRKERWLIQAQAGRLSEVEPALRRWLMEVEPEEGPDLCEAYANGLFVSGRAADAFVLIEAWQLQHPRDPQPKVMLGRWLEAQLQEREAEQQYLAALAVQPRNAVAAYALGRILLNRNEHEAARRRYSDAAESVLANAAPRLGIARCLMSTGSLDQALVILEDLNRLSDDEVRRSFALVQDPDPTRPISRYLGEALANQGDYERALPHLERALEVEPHQPALRYLKAQALRSTGDTEAAKALFTAIAKDREAMQIADRLVDEIAKSPDEPQIETRFQIAECFYLHDSKRRAEYWYKGVLQHDPQHAAAHARLAEYYALRAKTDPDYEAAAEHHRAQSSLASGD